MKYNSLGSPLSHFTAFINAVNKEAVFLYLYLSWIMLHSNEVGGNRQHTETEGRFSFYLWAFPCFRAFYIWYRNSICSYVHDMQNKSTHEQNIFNLCIYAKLLMGVFMTHSYARRLLNKAMCDTTAL